MKSIKYTLPEWSFLVGNSHDGDILKDRTVLLHFPSYTILEVVPLDEVKEFNFKGPTYQFTKTGKYSQPEKYLFYIHCTLSHDLDKIFEESSVWYCEYLEWAEKNTIIEEKSKQN